MIAPKNQYMDMPAGNVIPMITMNIIMIMVIHLLILLGSIDISLLGFFTAFLVLKNLLVFHLLNHCAVVIEKN